MRVGVSIPGPSWIIAVVIASLPVPGVSGIHASHTRMPASSRHPQQSRCSRVGPRCEISDGPCGTKSRPWNEADKRDEQVLFADILELRKSEKPEDLPKLSEKVMQYSRLLEIATSTYTDGNAVDTHKGGITDAQMDALVRDNLHGIGSMKLRKHTETDLRRLFCRMTNTTTEITEALDADTLVRAILQEKKLASKKGDVACRMIREWRAMEIRNWRAMDPDPIQVLASHDLEALDGRAERLRVLRAASLSMLREYIENAMHWGSIENAMHWGSRQRHRTCNGQTRPPESSAT